MSDDEWVTPTEAAQHQHDMLVLVVKLGLFALVVDVAVLITLAWQHEGQAITGVIVGLIFVLCTLGGVLYRLGQQAGRL